MIAVRPRPPSRVHPQGAVLEGDPAADPWEERGVAVVYRALLNSQMLGDVARAFVEPEVLENGVKAFSVLGFGRFSIELGSDDAGPVPVQQGGLPANWAGDGSLSSHGRNPGSSPPAAVAGTMPAFVRVLRAVREFVVSPEGIVCLSFVGWTGLMVAAVRAGLRVQQRRRSRKWRNVEENGRRRRSADRRTGRKAVVSSKAGLQFGVSERRRVTTGRVTSPPGR